MLIELLLDIIYWLVALILTPLQIVFEPLGSMAGLLELLSYASIFIPMTTFGLCLSTWFAYHAIRFAVVLINWLIAKVPTID